MDPSESVSFTDLATGGSQLRGSLERIQAAFFGPDYPMTTSLTLEVLPHLLEQLNILYRIIQAHLSQLASIQEDTPKRTVLVELRTSTNRARQAAADVLAATSLANQARTVRESQSKLQTFAELLEERNVAGLWEARLILELEAITDALHRIDRSLSREQADLRKPEPGGGTTASAQPSE